MLRLVVNRTRVNKRDTHLYRLPRPQTQQLLGGGVDGRCGPQQLVLGDDGGVVGVDPIRPLQQLGHAHQLCRRLGDLSRDHRQSVLGIGRIALLQDGHQELAELMGALVATVQSPLSQFRRLRHVVGGALADYQHVRDGLSRQVGGGDDVVLLVADSRRHGLGRRFGDSFRAANQVFGGDAMLAPVARVQRLEVHEVRKWATTRRKPTLISCPMASMVDSRALVPLVCSSSTALTVLRREVTLVTMTYEEKRFSFTVLVFFESNMRLDQVHVS
jgi:hypothetical protein